ncbi:hypothetical protein PMAYCL1PPCAC_04646, partial [Pristionchus mayeri]
QVIHTLANLTLTLEDVNSANTKIDMLGLLGDGSWDVIKQLDKFGEGPLGKFIHELLAYDDVDSIISAIICGQDITPETTGASTSGNGPPKRTVSDDLRDYIIKYVKDATPGVMDNSNETECNGVP